MSSSVIDKLVRPNIKQLKAYQSARGTAKAMQDFLLLDAAENPYSPFSEDDEGARYFNPLNRYPEPQPQDLLNRLSALYGVAPDNLIVSRGSEEAIRLLLQAFCCPQKEAVLSCPPTFALYAIEARIHDIENIQVPRLGEFVEHLDVENIVDSAKDPTSGVKMIFICNPGNPSSTALPVVEVDSVVRQLADHCMVVVDEAYIEFAEHESFVGKLADYPNLIVMRTLSKSYGLAGLRCGVVVAHSDVIGYLRRLIAAYPVPRPTQMLAEETLSAVRLKRMQEKQNVLKQERERLIKALRGCPSVKRIYPSQTNFLCIEVNDVKGCVQAFYDRKILIRDRSTAIPNAVNIAVGTKEQNKRVLEIVRSAAF